MCTRYITPVALDTERHWQVTGRNPLRWERELFPNGTGVFIRRLQRAQSFERELVCGQWALIPHFATERKLKYATVNARSEELANKASYRQPWARGQRCIVLAQAYFEPCWETGKHVPWRFTRADGQPWALAGLWNTWTEPSTGELVESYTLLTLSADAHPVMKRMHKPDPKLPPDQQDKRSVIPIELADVDEWLAAPNDQARQLLRLAAPELFVGEPVQQPKPSDEGLFG